MSSRGCACIEDACRGCASPAPVHGRVCMSAKNINDISWVTSSPLRQQTERAKVFPLSCTALRPLLRGKRALWLLL